MVDLRFRPSRYVGTYSRVRDRRVGRSPSCRPDRIDVARRIEPVVGPRCTRLSHIAVEAEERVHSIVGSELERLKLLRLVNPSIRNEEIEFFVSQQEHALAYIEQATIEPQAARVIITT